MKQFLKDKGYKQTSLSVQKANYAVNMYRKDEANRLAIGWDAKRELSKINYRIHTDKNN